MNANQQCLIRILQDHGNYLTTQQILDLTNNYPDLCRGCSSGTQVISAGMALIKKEIVKRKIAQGGFVWSLKN